MDKLKEIWAQFLTLKKWQKALVYFIIFMLISSISSMFSNQNQTSQSIPTASKTYTQSPPWYDSDLALWSDDQSLAYTSFEVSSSECGYGGCLGIIVQTQNGCSNTMYAEIELLDSSDINVGYSNDLIGRVSAGKKAKLIFHLSDSEILSAKNWNVTKINCY
jgi:hypothetical protein